MRKREIQAKHPKGTTVWWRHLRYLKRVVNKQVRKYWKGHVKDANNY